jgi:hypothetical protein
MVFEERIGFRKNGPLLVFGQTAMFFYWFIVWSWRSRQRISGCAAQGISRRPAVTIADDPALPDVPLCAR